MEAIRHDFHYVEEAMTAAREMAKYRAIAEARAVWLPKLALVALAIGAGIALAAFGLNSHPAQQVIVHHSGPWTSNPTKTPASMDPTKTPTSTDKVVQDFVIFYTIDIAEGRVESGWHFANELQLKPDRQWCHFIRPNSDGTSTAIPFEKMSGDLRVKCKWYEATIGAG